MVHGAVDRRAFMCTLQKAVLKIKTSLLEGIPCLFGT